MATETTLGNALAVPANPTSKPSSTKAKKAAVPKATKPKERAEASAKAKTPAPKKAAKSSDTKLAKKAAVPKAAKPKETAAASAKTKSPAPKKSATPKAPATHPTLTMLHFQVKFKTVHGQQIFVTGQHPLLGNGDPEKALPMDYLNEETWTASLAWTDHRSDLIEYGYLLKNADGSLAWDESRGRYLPLPSATHRVVRVIDAWNHPGYAENVYSAPAFQEVLLPKPTVVLAKKKTRQKATHLFRIKAPLLQPGECVWLTGSAPALGQWEKENALPLQYNPALQCWEGALDLGKTGFPLAYKYALSTADPQAPLLFESGDNRVLFESGATVSQTVVQDGFIRFANRGWRGAGVAMPVFSLRTESSWGCGDFTDLQSLANWAAGVGLRLIQLLPVNDTTANRTWTDSYPYAAISAFALHPLYLNPAWVAQQSGLELGDGFEAERKALNDLPEVDYEKTLALKEKIARLCFEKSGKKELATAAFKVFFEQNQTWLQPYAIFCALRDQYGTVDYTQWPEHQTYGPSAEALANAGSALAPAVAYHYFVQYHLHLQLLAATKHAHALGIILKGDIAIGVFRHGADTWQEPELFHMDFQAGAPPDDFAVTGQNWGFPTYNWEKMQATGFAWWKRRFAQMSYYFDAFRIDHILGFFRIWSIPMEAVEGILGHFVPALPVRLQTFHQQGIWFDHARYTQPFINETVLWETFGYDNELVKSLFLKPTAEGQYQLLPAFDTQRKVEAHFAALEKDEHHAKIQQGLYALISNVILLEADESHQAFHFRIGMENTSSFKQLAPETQAGLKALYVDYFYHRQDELWKAEALKKLPALKRETKMIVCGEDLGMVPACVPDVMRDLGLLSLEIQRMPKDASRSFFHPNDAPYLSVVTPSTHDMSTVRGWWEEDPDKTRAFYNHELGQWGDPPVYGEAWINKIVVQQHLYSPAMWSIFQLQDILGMDPVLRRSNPAEERINVPANPKHYWRYRMHLSFADLEKASDFNAQFKTLLAAAGR